MASRQESILRMFDALGGGNERKAGIYAEHVRGYSEETVRQAVEVLIAHHEQGPVRPAHLIERCKVIEESRHRAFSPDTEVRALTQEEMELSADIAFLGRNGMHWYGHEHGFRKRGEVPMLPFEQDPKVARRLGVPYATKEDWTPTREKVDAAIRALEIRQGPGTEPPREEIPTRAREGASGPKTETLELGEGVGERPVKWENPFD